MIVMPSGLPLVKVTVASDAVTKATSCDPASSLPLEMICGATSNRPCAPEPESVIVAPVAT